jgi:hypothetical protein
LISNVSQSVSHSVNVTIPSLTAAREAEQKLESVAPPKAMLESDAELSSYIDDAGGDYHLALMRLRRDLEMELRRILGKETSFALRKSNRKLFGLTSLWNMFKVGHPEQDRLEPALFYVADVCNASAHGQDVPEPNAHEALSMGLRILDTLRAIEQS